MRLFRFTKARIAFLHDVFMAAISFPLALYIRVGDSFFWYADRVLLVGTVVFTAVAALCFWSMRLYRGVWHYASLNDVMQIAKAATVAILIFMSLMFVITRLDDIPRSMLVIEWLLLISLVGGSRIAYRIAKDKRFDTMLRKENYRRIPVLLFGAGDMAEQFIRATTLPENATHQVVGLIDDHGTRIGRKIHGVDVLGGLTDFEDIVRALQTRGNAPQRVIVATADIDGKQMRELLNRAQAMGLPLSRIPRMTDLQSGDEDGIPTRPIAVEDLLGRPQKVLDRDAMRTLVEGRRVLITGAGGTIGSELARQIAGLAPRQISLLDSSEFALYEIDLEIGIALPDLPRSIALADVRDRARVQRVFETEAPEIVFHAAALKHVPMVENNPLEGVLTNVVGTRNVADAARQRKIATVVLISTDKAVNPTNVMGATKRLAETYCQALDILGADEPAATRFVTVRFGNVLGSTGSVVPLFQRQIDAGGPVTVTHPEVTRFFMTTREAVELVIEASALGSRRAKLAGKIFVLDMGEPVRIQDLARQMIRLAGRRPDSEIEVAFTGLRPGEKLYEELMHSAEQLIETEMEGIYVASPRTADHAFLSRAFDALEEGSRNGRYAEILDHLKRLVPEFAHQPGGAG
ncbi:MAG: polysaccharide biosynthesis protein, partial [Rhodospirillaceae bacterium]|nr:polysaccharide biosynthesis protein [Rhodospirillaceae bacterium]